MKSVHDYVIYKYEVLSNENRIVFHTTYKDFSKSDNATIEFEGVIGHFFEHSLAGNIIFDITASDDLATFYKDYEKDLLDYFKYGLPLEADTLNSFVKEMEKKRLKAFEISSSYGLSGWVIAKNCKVIKNKT